uniref:Alpha-D-phosphohexomutase C-terminal domain-containing protein n=1 Tax=Amphimedon queenslandica TaxID=400682 RepID=A0A1X7TBJ2_AMPQE
MGNLSHTLLEKGEEVVFAFEEAIGFMFGTTVLDKDGYPSIQLVLVVYVSDITFGYDSTRPPHYKPILPVDLGSQMIMFYLDSNCEFTLRTSGTEPKIKYYVYMFSPPGVHADESSLKDTLSRTVDDIITEFIKPDYYNLIYRSI